jgi:hypothetical protein
VEVWSVSSGRWFVGVVVEADAGFAYVRYGEGGERREKKVDLLATEEIRALPAGADGNGGGDPGGAGAANLPDAAWTVKDLKACIVARGGSAAGITERGELVDKARVAWREARTAGRPGGGGDGAVDVGSRVIDAPPCTLYSLRREFAVEKRAGDVRIKSPPLY